MLMTVSARFGLVHEDVSSGGDALRAPAPMRVPVTLPTAVVADGRATRTPATDVRPNPVTTAAPLSAIPSLTVATAGAADREATKEAKGDVLSASRKSPVWDFPDTALGRHLRTYMAVMEGMGPNAETNYQESLDELRKNAEEATALLFETYQRMEEQRYLDRWKIVDALASLANHGALRALAAIVAAPIPEERYPGVHGRSSRSEEAMIRAAAIRGIEALAQRGVAEADIELLNLIKAPDLAVREKAVLAYLRTGVDRQQRVQELRTILAPEDHWMLQLQEHADVRLMPQPSPADATPSETFRPQGRPPKRR
jgi:hypothetical protein